MATKPIVTVPLWASQANWTVGADIGSATKQDSTAFAVQGHIGGAGTPTMAFHQNDWQNKVSQYCKWVEEGSSIGIGTAHIVETDVTGKASLSSLQVNNDITTVTLDVAGATETRTLEVDGLGINDTVVKVTAGASGNVAAWFNTPSVSDILLGGDSFGIQITAQGVGMSIGVVGADRVPLTLFPQYTRPVSLSGQDGSIGFEAVSISGADPTSMYAVLGGTKRGVPLYDQQWVHQMGDTPGGATFNGEVGSPTTLISAFDFVQVKAPLDAGLSMLYELSFTSNSVGGLDFWVRVRNNGVLMHDIYVWGGGSPGVAREHFVRRKYTGALATNGNSFDVVGFKLTGQGGGNSIIVSNMIMTIHTAI